MGYTGTLASGTGVVKRGDIVATGRVSIPFGPGTRTACTFGMNLRISAGNVNGTPSGRPVDFPQITAIYRGINPDSRYGTMSVQ